MAPGDIKSARSGYMSREFLTLQLSCAFTDKMRQVLNIISGGDTKAADEIFSSNLHITITIVK